MKIDAVGVTSSNFAKTIQFYSILGFDFSDVDTNKDHIEPKTPDGSARLMIDKSSFMHELYGTKPIPSNHASFAIRFEFPAELDKIAKKLKQNNFTVIKEPWDAFWNQRYSVVEDPDGYKVDLYADLT